MNPKFDITLGAGITSCKALEDGQVGRTEKHVAVRK